MEEFYKKYTLRDKISVLGSIGWKRFDYSDKNR